MPNGYIVASTVRYQDGTESSAKIFVDLDTALRYANELKDDINPHNIFVRIFELGKEVEIEEVVVKKKVEVEKEKKVYRLKEKK